MKKLNLIYTLLILTIFASCKKDQPAKSDIADKPPVIAAVHDSVSYTVDGKVYMAGTPSITSSGNQQVNQKIVYAKDGSYSFVGNPDSVLFYWSNSIISHSNATLTISVIKKYNKKDINKAFLYYPALEDMLKQYAIGKHPYMENFGRENSQNGIALSISANNRNYSSYPPSDLQHITRFKPGFQKDSKFESISFTKATSGGYNLEARFTAVMLDDFTEEPKKLENGYLRLYLNTTFYPLF